MKAPLVFDVYLGCAKPMPAEITLERAIGCGRRPLFCYKIGPKWAHLLYVPTLTPVRVRASHLQTLVVSGTDVDVGEHRLARELLKRIRNQARYYSALPGAFYAPAAVSEAMAVLEKIID